VSLSNILTPLLGEIGIGGLGGFLAGYALKKAAKIVATIVALFFLALQYLSTQGVITMNYPALEGFVAKMMGISSGAQGWVVNFVAHAPFGASFIGGFYLGLKKG